MWFKVVNVRNSKGLFGTASHKIAALISEKRPGTRFCVLGARSSLFAFCCCRRWAEARPTQSVWRDFFASSAYKLSKLGSKQGLRRRDQGETRVTAKGWSVTNWGGRSSLPVAHRNGSARVTLQRRIPCSHWCPYPW